MTGVGELLGYPFVVNALVSGSAVAVASAVSGYFMVCRRMTFAGHALPNIGFAGAAGAVLVGAAPIYGLLVLTLGSAALMALLGRDLRERDVTIGVVMTSALGLGLLFLSLYSGYAAQVYGILFGSILGISAPAARLSVEVTVGVLAALALLYRPLLFSTFDAELAGARGVPVLLVSVAFFLLLAVVVSTAVTLMGALLLFTLMVGPAATATRLVRGPVPAILLSAGLGLAYAWGGILAAAASGVLPVSFCIATLSFLVYLPVRLLVGPRARARSAAGALPVESA